MQRVLGASGPPGTPMMKPPTSPKKPPSPADAIKKDEPQKKDISTQQLKQTSAPGSPQRKPSTSAAQPAKTEAAKELGSQKQATPAPGQKNQETGPQKPPEQTSQTGQKQSNTTSNTKEESGSIFGFGSPKTKHAAAKPVESLGGKMFGFGSSVFSSASTLINSAVQDESKTTPPVSPKMPAAKAGKSPPVTIKEQEKKQDQAQQPEASPSLQPKVDQSKSPKKAEASLSAPTAGQSTCPLCKAELNLGSKDPPNYNKCTECKNTVCNQCGFCPMPKMSEVIKALHLYLNKILTVPFSHLETNM